MKRSLWLLGIVFALAAGCRVADAPSGSEPPVLRPVGEYTLVDHTGAAFGSAALAGHPYVVSFFFTRCPSICPKIMSVMSGLQTTLAGSAPQARLVSITVDPENDQPEVLAAYAAKMKMDTAKWHLVTGDPASLEAVVTKQFVTYMGKPETQPSGLMDIGHGGHLLLIDGKGQLRGTYEATDAGTPGRLLADIRALTGGD